MFEDTDIDMEYVIAGVVITACMILVLSILIYAYHNATKPTITLLKSCTQSHVETHLRPMGMAFVPVTETICTQYNPIPE